MNDTTSIIAISMIGISSLAAIVAIVSGEPPRVWIWPINAALWALIYLRK